MSFLYRTQPLLRTAVRPSVRCFSTTLAQQKGPVDAAKDTLKTADRAVSDQLVKGLDKAAEARDAVASVAGEGADKAQGKAAQAAGQAKGKAAEVEGKAKGKVEEVKGKI